MPAVDFEAWRGCLGDIQGLGWQFVPVGPFFSRQSEKKQQGGHVADATQSVARFGGTAFAACVSGSAACLFCVVAGLHASASSLVTSKAVLALCRRWGCLTEVSLSRLG